MMAGASLCQCEAGRPQTQVLEEAFRLFDKDGDGNITSSELQSVMNSLGQPVDLRQAKEMINSVDKDGNGLIDFDEFSEMMRGRLSTLPTSPCVNQLGDDFRSLFMAFDKDNSGYIDGDELRQTMSAVGLQLTDHDVTVMMKAAGVPTGGRIYYEEFLKMMTHQMTQFSQCHVDSSSLPCGNSQDDLPELCEAFSLFDKDGDGQITVEEVVQTMTSLGIDVRLSDVQIMVEQVDTDGNGSISFDEFANLMRSYQSYKLAQSCESLVGDTLLRETFEVFDKDHDGYLNAEDLRNTMKQLGLSLSEYDLQAMMKSVGVGPQGKITFQDFCKIFSFTGSLTKDEDSPSASAHKQSAQCEPDRNDELKAVFALFDKDGDGFITMLEVTNVLLSMGISPSSDSIREIFEQVDLDGNGEIDFDEFVQLVERCSKPASSDQEIRDMFNAIDKDHSGFVDADELKETFIALGIPLSDDDVRRMMKDANVEGRHIYYEDFVRIITTKLDGFDVQKTVSEMSLANGGRSVILQREVPSDDALQLQELHVQFAQFDKDGDGRITQDEFASVMTSLGYTVDADEVDSMLRAADTDRNGTIDFAEFRSLMRRHQQTASAADAHHAFKVFDKNSDGYIDEQELQQTMKELGVTLTSDDVTAMFTEAGCKDQRRITYEEFLTLVTGAAQILDISCSADAGTDVRHSRMPVSQPVSCPASSQVLSTSAPSLSESSESVEMKQIRRLVSTDSATRSDVRSQPAPNAWQAFRVFDRNSDGYISKSELYHTLKELGVNLSLEELNSQMKEADSNQDGRIDYAEFCQLMQGAFESYARRAALLHRQKSVTATSVEQTVVDRSKMRQNLALAFSAVDSNHDGRINAEQLLEVAKVVGMKVKSVRHAQALVTKYGSRGDGNICFKEFKLIQSHCEAGRQRTLSQKSLDAEQRMRSAFKVFDIDSNGFIDAGELRATLTDLGSCVSLPDAEALLRAADKNGDGQIDYEEFILMLYP